MFDKEPWGFDLTYCTTCETILNVILSAAYQVLSIPRQHCPPDQSIETESECKQAADQVGLPYKNRDNWADSLPKCLAHKGRVYFNTHDTEGMFADIAVTAGIISPVSTMH